MPEDSSSSSVNRPDRQVVWLAVAAMACLLLLALAALGMAFFLNHSQPSINNSTTITSLEKTQPAPAASPAPLERPQRPGDAAQAPASRMSQPLTGVPDKLPDGSSQQPVRADKPPHYETLLPATKVLFRVREQPDGPQNMRGPVPFRVRAYMPAADGTVADVAASKPQGGDEDQYSYLPDQAFKPSSAKSGGISVEVLNPRKSSVVNDLRAPKDFQFLVAELRVKNLGKKPLNLDPDAFEVRDDQDLRYLANPELLSSSFPQQPMDPGEKASFQIAFLVPADAPLSSLATTSQAGESPLLSPLQVR
jgi:hypothetical protein